jgi:hypothetical protein
MGLTVTRAVLRTALALAVLAAVAACSGHGSTGTQTQTPGSCTATGTLAGTAFAAVDCYSRPDTPSADSPYSGELHIVDFAGACSRATAQQYKPNSGELQILFISDQLAPSTYEAACLTKGCVDVGFVTYDAACMVTGPDEATGGTVVLTQADASGIRGTFDLTFGADHLSGTIDAPTCGPATSPASCN